MFFKKRIVVGDESLATLPRTDDEIRLLCFRVAESLTKRLPTEQDTYWFVVEQYDRLFDFGGHSKDMLANCPLFELEFKGSRSETSYVGAPNPGIVFLDKSVMPVLEGHYGTEIAQRMRATIYVFFCNKYRAEVDSVRIKYAAHYQNNCRSKGSMKKAEEWGEIISSIQGLDAPTSSAQASSQRGVVSEAVDRLGVEEAAKIFAKQTMRMLPTRAIAWQFILEEIEAASDGNSAAIQFAAESGISELEYEGSLENSCPEVDGPGGPQQGLVRASFELRHDEELMVEFRTAVVDQIMAHYSFGKYSGAVGEVMD